MTADLRQALERVQQVLTVPAAEYVPAIPDAWAIIDQALALHADQGGGDDIYQSFSEVSFTPEGKNLVGAAEAQVGQFIYRRIETLMDAKAGTHGGAELTYLAAIVGDVEEYGATGAEDYQREPFVAPDPALTEAVGRVRAYEEWLSAPGDEGNPYEGFGLDCGQQKAADLRLLLSTIKSPSEH
jgi:hypothetical protein